MDSAFLDNERLVVTVVVTVVVPTIMTVVVTVVVTLVVTVAVAGAVHGVIIVVERVVGAAVVKVVDVPRVFRISGIDNASHRIHLTGSGFRTRKIRTHFNATRLPTSLNL